MYFGTDTSRVRVLYKMGRAQLYAGKPEVAYRTFVQVLKDFPGDTVYRDASILYCSMALVEMNDYFAALVFLEQFPVTPKHYTARNVWLGYLFLMTGEEYMAVQMLYNAGIKIEPKYVFKELRKSRRKRRVALMMSVLVPGAGQWLYGRPVEATSALAINAALFWIGIPIALASPLDGVLFVMPLLGRYYVGSIAKLDLRAKRHIAATRKAEFLKLLPSF